MDSAALTTEHRPRQERGRRRRLVGAAVMLAFSGLVAGLAASWWMAGQLMAPAPFTSVLLRGGLPESLGAVPFAVQDERERFVRGWRIPADAISPVLGGCRE